jgi:hypothetical protein
VVEAFKAHLQVSAAPFFLPHQEDGDRQRGGNAQQEQKERSHAWAPDQIHQRREQISPTERIYTSEPPGARNP